MILQGHTFAWGCAAITLAVPAQVTCQDQKKKSVPQNLKIQK